MRFLSILGVFFFLAFDASARPLRRAYSGGTMNFVPQASRLAGHNTPVPLPQTNRPFQFNYQHALDAIFTDKIEVKMAVKDAQVLANPELYVANITLTSLRNSVSSAERTVFLKVEGDSAIATVDELEPETAYRMKVTIWKFDEKADPKYTFVANLPTDYLAVTGGDSEAGMAAAKVMNSALAEFYLWEMGYSGRASRGYCGGGWCNAFANWNLHRVVHLHKLPIVNDLAQRARNLGRVHGSFVTVNGGSHYTLILAYDHHLRQFWTVDGNFNNRVVLTRYSPGNPYNAKLITDESVISQ